VTEPDLDAIEARWRLTWIRTRSMTDGECIRAAMTTGPDDVAALLALARRLLAERDALRAERDRVLEQVVRAALAGPEEAPR
jgi:hypothetical protein